MKSLAIAAILGAASARVHSHFAERNFICEMCQTVIEHAAQGQHGEIEKLFAQFPKLEEKIAAYTGNSDVLDLTDAKKTCLSLQLCMDDTVSTLLMEEAPLDLESIVAKVNANPQTNWKAAVPNKFAGASRKEV